MQIPLIKGDKVDSDVDYRDALPVNMTAINHPIKGAVGYMNQWYGLTFFTEGEGVDRAARWVSRSTFQGHYRVSGNSFIKVGSDQTATNLGSISGSEQVSIAFSFNNIAIVADQKLFYYNPTSGLRQITDTDIGSPIDIVWADGLFILTDSETIYQSSALNEELFEPLDFGTAEFRPDATYGVGINEDNELLAFGSTTIEYFSNTGNANFQYSRIALKALKLGILGTHCKKEFKGKWCVIGRREETSPGVYIVQGGSSKKISTREVDKLLDQYPESTYSAVTIDAIVDDSVTYLILHLPTITLLYNDNIGTSMGVNLAWSILKSDVSGNAIYRGKNFVRSPDLSRWVGGDQLNSNIGTLDDSVATQYGEIAEWILYTPMVRLETLSVNTFEIETIPGFSPDDDATVFISQSEDGVTYSQEWLQLYGQDLNYKQRFYMRALGYVRKWISYKLRGASRSRMNFNFLNIEAS